MHAIDDEELKQVCTSLAVEYWLNYTVLPAIYQILKSLHLYPHEVFEQSQFPLVSSNENIEPRVYWLSRHSQLTEYIDKRLFDDLMASDSETHIFIRLSVQRGSFVFGIETQACEQIAAEPLPCNNSTIACDSIKSGMHTLQLIRDFIHKYIHSASAAGTDWSLDWKHASVDQTILTDNDESHDNQTKDLLIIPLYSEIAECSCDCGTTTIVQWSMHWEQNTIY